MPTISYGVNAIVIRQLREQQYTLAVTSLITYGYPRTAMYFAGKYSMDSQLLNWLLYGSE
jgi:hypothetical protein